MNFEEFMASAPTVLGTADAAAYLGVSQRYLEQLRADRVGPACRRRGKRDWIYDIVALDKCLPGGRSEYWSREELADSLRVTKRTLETWHAQKKDPPFVRFGERKFFYKKSAVRAWLNAQHELGFHLKRSL